LSGGDLVAERVGMACPALCCSTSAAGVSAGAAGCAGSVMGAPNTISAAEMLLSDLGADLMFSRTHGRWSGQSVSAPLAARPSFSYLWTLSTIPLLWGCLAVVLLCAMPSLAHTPAHTAEVNCVPLSDVTLAGTPNLHTQLLMRASTMTSVSMLARGMASNHLLVRSMKKKKKKKTFIHASQSINYNDIERYMLDI
jgi:hypothetical protein